MALKLSDIDTIVCLKGNLEEADIALEKMTDPVAQLSATVHVYDQRSNGDWSCAEVIVEWRLLKEVIEKQKLLDEDALRDFGVDVEWEDE